MPGAPARSPIDRLGPAIVRAIVDAHSGTVRLESEPGLGTTVDLTLPCA